MNISKSQKAGIIILLSILALLLVILLPIVLRRILLTPLQQAQTDAIRRLVAANSISDLRAAVGIRGIVYVCADNSWLAIWYDRVDSEHSSADPAYWHDAVVLDSAGEWFENPAYHDWFAYVGKLDPRTDQWLIDPQIRGFYRQAVVDQKMRFYLTTAPTLSAAKAALLNNGFFVIHPQVIGAPPRIVAVPSDRQIAPVSLSVPTTGASY